MKAVRENENEKVRKGKRLEKRLKVSGRVVNGMLFSS